MILAFDVYGTLIDTSQVQRRLESLVGSNASAFSDKWREKQLEYSFRRAAMSTYVPFAICVEEALMFCNEYFKTQLSSAARDELLSLYANLPAFPEVDSALATLRSKTTELWAFSNGTQAAVSQLLEANQLIDYFNGVVSVDEVQTFKPSPKVYQHFAQRVGIDISECCLVSGNSFDVLGALNTGMRAVWVKRSEKQVFDPWGVDATVKVADLRQLAALSDTLLNPS